MELGPIKDELERVQEHIRSADPASEKYEVLLKRQDDLVRIISNEEKRQAKDEIERDKNAREIEAKYAELNEGKKNRIVTVTQGVLMLVCTLAGIYADETRVICTAATRHVNEVKKSFSSRF